LGRTAASLNPLALLIHHRRFEPSLDIQQRPFARYVFPDSPHQQRVVDVVEQLGVTRQTVLHRVKRGELDAVLVCYGRRKGPRIKVLDEQPGLFDPSS